MAELGKQKKAVTLVNLSLLELKFKEVDKPMQYVSSKRVAIIKNSLVLRP